MDSFIITTKSAMDTQKIAMRLAKEMVAKKSDKARVIALSGDLGAGKTTFTQGFARALGIKTPVQSPTFVLMKIYALDKKTRLKHLVHIDAYRIEKTEEIKHLGLHELLRDKDAVLLIEWAERIKKLLPRDTIWITMEHGKKINERMIQIKS